RAALKPPSNFPRSKTQRATLPVIGEYADSALLSIPIAHLVHNPPRLALSPSGLKSDGWTRRESNTHLHTGGVACSRYTTSPSVADYHIQVSCFVTKQSCTPQRRILPVRMVAAVAIMVPIVMVAPLPILLLFALIASAEVLVPPVRFIFPPHVIDLL